MLNIDAKQVAQMWDGVTTTRVNAAFESVLGRHGMTRLFTANSWRPATWMQNIVINDGEDVFNPHNAYAKYRHWNKRTIWSVLAS